MKQVRVEGVRSWASQFAGETRDPDWLHYSYVVPDVLNDISRELAHTSGGLIGLVGPQGVGKSSALLALSLGIPFALNESRILFKWRREKDLYATLVNNTHEASNQFLGRYVEVLAQYLRHQITKMSVTDEERFIKFLECISHRKPQPDDIIWAERIVGKAVAQRLQQETWRAVLSTKEVILIDTPDYSKTDKRQMDADLQDIYWFWNNRLSTGTLSSIIVAVQKETFQGHFFLDKMEKFELRPLKAKQMVEAYQRTFDTTYPFTEQALLTVARMSRGIFRRFQRYIVLTLDLWLRPGRSELIDENTVRKAVPLERIAEDMELEFSGLFPRHSELRTLAVKVLLHLQERGPLKQSQIVQELDVEPSAMSRLLKKLETSKQIKRTRDGTDKIVSLVTDEYKT